MELTLQEVAELTGSTLEGDPRHKITGVSELDGATEDQVSFITNPRYLKQAHESRAGALFIHSKTPRSPGRNYLINDIPDLAFQKLAEHFFPEFKKTTGFEGIHPTAVVHPSAKIGHGVTLGPYSVIDAEAIIGDRTIILSGCSVGYQSIIGSDCLLYPHVVIRERCKVGNRVILQPGAIIGSCGFGYRQDKQGKHQKLNQIGTVEIEDDVEIGALTSVDRARFTVTRIEEGSKIDNLVQIAHGVVIGKHNLIAGQTGIAGSTKTGDYNMFGGQVGIDGHLTLGPKVVVTARSGVTKSLQPGIYSGFPATDIKVHNRNTVLLRNIEKYINR